MNSLLSILLMSPPQDGGKGGMGGTVFMLLTFVIIIYFFMILPQKRRTKKMNAFRDEIGKGTKIITTGGIHGKIVSVHDTSFVIETEGQGRLKIEKSAISMEMTQALNQGDSKEESSKS
jgi:preprotein translocase subunit YajC